MISLKHGAETEHTPVNPVDVKKWLDEKQDKFLDALNLYGDEVGLGYQVVLLPGVLKGATEFTGKFLCPEANLALFTAFRNVFGEKSDVRIVHGNILFQNPVPENSIQEANYVRGYVNHTWLRFAGSDGKRYWICGTPGQIRPSMRGIIAMGRGEIEQDFFRYGYDGQGVEDITEMSKLQRKNLVRDFQKVRLFPGEDIQLKKYLALEESLIP